MTRSHRLLTTPAFGLLAVLSTLAACAGSAPGSEQGTAAPVSLPHADEVGLLRFLNDAAVATFATLDETCAIRSDSADLLVIHRDGPDGVPGTADDDAFDRVSEVEAVRHVGPWTIDRLVGCAAALGYLGTPEDRQVLAFLNDQRGTSLRVLHQGCGLRSEPATALAVHRDGPDGVPGTADDNLFDDPEEVQAQPAVGAWTLTLLRVCAARTAGDTAAAAAESATEVHDLVELDAALATFIQGELLTYAQQHADAALAGEVRFGGEVVVHAVGAEPVRYDVLYLQGAGSTDGATARLVVTLDANHVVQTTRLLK